MKILEKEIEFDFFDAEQIYSYIFDNDLIYSALKIQYDIDLAEIDYLYWWKFKAAFNGLKVETKLYR